MCAMWHAIDAKNTLQLLNMGRKGDKAFDWNLDWTHLISKAL